MTTLWLLIKFFDKEEWADAFMRGRLHLKSLSYFKMLEDNDQDGRADRHEVSAAWWQHDSIAITLTTQTGESIEISKDDMVGAVV